ncbi:cation diffusion facilitator family transporter [Marinicella litoralis]|uniref:Cobalt-zinc-cadmium efflux system protein n=1 Tax=Marinicella litoralis TaxID=644220 RepID=A0A4R6XI04_9GAMM|nr:cation diffusion facilitator family transporter [Marinicella litoralis]TDR16773.1 cobalt-zinc-cadmium efflux system protein [Marinicella litoralis]
MNQPHNHSDHSHDHDHGHHDHSVAVNQDNKVRVLWAMVLTFAFMFAEIIGGLISGSLALLADAGHMFSDALALLLSWLAFKYSDKGADEARSFGWHRFQILAAFVNGMSLLVIAAWIVIEAAQRFFQPVTVMATPMLVIAVLGLIVNIVVFKILSGGDQENLNLKSAMIHVLGDLLGSVAAIVAAILIMYFGWYWADPVLSVLVAVLILRSGWHVVKKSAHILIEGSPDEVDEAKVKQQLIADIPSVVDVHHIHVWSLTNDINLMTLHVTIDEIQTETDVLKAIKTSLKQHFEIQHTTIQVEHLPCPDDDCQM